MIEANSPHFKQMIMIMAVKIQPPSEKSQGSYVVLVIVCKQPVLNWK